MFARITNIYREYPKAFWTLIGGSFVDRLGGALIFPFFALFITEKFGVGMTQVGLLFSIFSVTGLAGSFLGGALTDRLGRRWMLIFSLVVSALSSVLMGLVDSLGLFYGAAMLAGLLAHSGGPAQQAMVADLLPEGRRAEGFGILRVAINLAVTIGPAVGGLLAASSYLLLFVADAISSLITASIVFLKLPETKPQTAGRAGEENFGQALSGYRVALRDTPFMAFLVVSILMVSVYTQMNTTLSVYLRDVHGIPAQGYGLVLSLNAAMVVLLQFWVTRRISGRPVMLMMAAGAALYGLGFGMYGFISGPRVFLLALLAMVVITLGEMIASPVAQAVAAKFAPEHMRGRYMAMFGFSWMLPFAIAPLAAGVIMDHFDPRWVWYLSGLISLLATLGFIVLHGRTRAGAIESSPQAASG
jgi:MFS family permease